MGNGILNNGRFIVSMHYVEFIPKVIQNYKVYLTESR